MGGRENVGVRTEIRCIIFKPIKGIKKTQSHRRQERRKRGRKGRHMEITPKMMIYLSQIPKM